MKLSRLQKLPKKEQQTQEPTQDSKQAQKEEAEANQVDADSIPRHRLLNSRFCHNGALFVEQRHRLRLLTATH